MHAARLHLPPNRLSRKIVDVGMLQKGLVRHLVEDWNSTLMAMEQMKEVLDTLRAQLGCRDKLR